MFYRPVRFYLTTIFFPSIGSDSPRRSTDGGREHEWFSFPHIKLVVWGTCKPVRLGKSTGVYNLPLSAGRNSLSNFPPFLLCIVERVNRDCVFVLVWLSLFLQFLVSVAPLKAWISLLKATGFNGATLPKRPAGEEDARPRYSRNIKNAWNVSHTPGLYESFMGWPLRRHPEITRIIKRKISTDWLASYCESLGDVSRWQTYQESRLTESFCFDFKEVQFPNVCFSVVVVVVV